ncbi:helix-turn-helix domain-containing protein [Enterococcus cecorum]|uniref:helix-turn-helix domain-containing protein n=1 Tax=Enterococcus cecorum TaxID=44008 RepID=UPI00148B9E88|nr:helix-turn-helix transcriptional regulator [Enterococcus cecorum]
MENKNLFQIVKTLCREKGITQKELAKIIDVSQNTIKNWENNLPNGDTLLKIADYFGVTTDYLLGRSSNKSLTRKNERDIQKSLEQIYDGLDDSLSLAYLNNGGVELSEEDAELLKSALQFTITQAKIRAKEKYTRKDYKRKSE